MPNHFDGPGMMGPDPLWAHFAMAGLSTLLWMFLMGLFIWGVLSWLRERSSGERRLMSVEHPLLSPADRLRLAYVAGDIDALTYEMALDRLLASASSIEAALSLLQPAGGWRLDEPGSRDGELV